MQKPGSGTLKILEDSEGRRLQVRNEMTRREILRAGLVATSLLAIGVPEWAIPALAQGETLVPFTDIPENFNPGNPTSPVRIYDNRKITT